MQGFFHQQYEYGKFNPLNALHLLHSEVTPPPLRHNVSLDRFGLSTYPEPRYLHTKTPTEVHPRKIRTSVGPSPGATQQNHLSNPIIEKLFKKSHTKFYPPGKLTKFPGYFYSVRWLFNKPLPWNWICDSVPWRLCQFCQRFQGEKKFSKALGAWLLVRGVSQRKRRRRGRRRYFPWRGCALPRCNLRGGGFMRTESGGFENTLSLLRIICSLIIIITKTVKIDSIENLYWMCFHCVLCLGSIGNISEHVLYGTLPMAVKQSDGCLEKDLSLWRQGRGNRDKFSHNVELSPAKVNEKRLFFCPIKLILKKVPTKNQENPEKKQNKSLCWSAFGRMAFGACSKKSDLVGLVADVSAIPVFLGICLGQAISVLRYQPWKSAETSNRPFMRTGKKTPTNKSERSTEATKPKSCSFFKLAYTTSWDKWFVFWISSRSSSFTFELRLSPL